MPADAELFEAADDADVAGVELCSGLGAGTIADRSSVTFGGSVAIDP